MQFVRATPEYTAKDAILWLPDLVDCPKDLRSLARRLQLFENYLLKNDNQTVGWMALQKADAWGIVGFVVRPEFRRRWLSRAVMKSFADNVFVDREVVTFDTKVPEVLRMALRLGAKPIYDSNVPNMYGLSRDSFAKRLH